MKKVILMFLMVIAGMFASPLFAIDTIKVGCATSKSQAVKSIECVKSTQADVTYVKVDIQHKDSLMCSLATDKLKQLNKEIPRISGGHKASSTIKIAKANVVVVCYMRGEGGLVAHS